MTEPLDSIEARVLGSLLEKEAATPEYYPLSLNALVNACNQRSSRVPVVDYGESEVLEAIERLRHKKLAAVIVGNGRVNKYAERIAETMNLGRRELAILCVLLLRGPQTIAEIKERCERLYSFGELDEVESVLTRMESLTRRLERRPGQKETRYMHLLSGDRELESPASEREAKPCLESEIADLKRRVELLEKVVLSK